MKKIGYLVKVKMTALIIIDDSPSLDVGFLQLDIIEDDEVVFNPQLTLFNGVKCDGKMCGLGKYAGGGSYVCPHNNLAVMKPGLISEWDYEKNGDLDPYKIAVGSNKKVQWVCRSHTSCENHVWEAAVNSRTGKGTGCPFCNCGSQVCPCDSLAAKYPGLISEWDYEKNGDLDPNKISVSSHMKVQWVCRSHSTCQYHVWEATVDSRTGQSTGCPFCYGNNKVCSCDSLAVKYPDLMLEWDYEKNGDLDPNKISISSGKKVWWVCRSHTSCENHVWAARVADRTGQQGSKCPFCDHKQTCPCDSLAAKYPDLMLEWDYEKNEGLDPNKIAVGSDIKAWWVCRGHTSCEGHIWEATVKNRTGRGDGCPFCNGGRQTCPCDSLAAKYPGLLEEWDYEKNEGLDPNKISVSSNKNVQWVCRSHTSCEGHVWTAPVYSRTGRGTGCPFCNGGRQTCPCDSLAAKYPGLLEEWDYEKNAGLDPNKISVSSNKNVQWVCRSHTSCEGHVWTATVAHRTGRGTGCPFCSNTNKVCPCDSLAAKYPDILEEWDYEKNAGLDPNKVSLHSGIKVQWVCKNATCHNTWITTVNNRTRRGDGCPRCRPSGYSKAQIAWLQQIEQEQGITIQHALSPEGEFFIPGVGKVDGYHSQSNTIFEFHGDFWHGTPTKYKPSDINPTSKKAYGFLYARTIARDEKIRRLGYTLVTKWEGHDPSDPTKWVCDPSEMVPYLQAAMSIVIDFEAEEEFSGDEEAEFSGDEEGEAVFSGDEEGDGEED